MLHSTGHSFTEKLTAFIPYESQNFISLKEPMHPCIFFTRFLWQWCFVITKVIWLKLSVLCFSLIGWQTIHNRGKYESEIISQREEYFNLIIISLKNQLILQKAQHRWNTLLFLHSSKEIKNRQWDCVFPPTFPKARTLLFERRPCIGLFLQPTPCCP